MTFGLRLEWLLLAGALAVPTGCGPEPVAESPPRLELTFVGDWNTGPGTRLEAVDPELFGGLSALAYDPELEAWFALSDARTESRFFRLEVGMEGGELAIEPVATYFITDASGESFSANMLDPEGLARSPWDTWLVSTEPDLRDDPPEQAKVLEIDRNGGFIRSLQVPEKLLADGWPPDRGVRHNLGFEALTFSPEGAWLFLGAEATLLQDGPPAGFDNPGFCRIVRFAVEGDGLAASAEYVYPVGPFAEVEGFEGSVVSGGLVELVALSPERLLALERIFVQEIEGQGRNVTRARIYEVDLSSATDVRDVASLSSELDWRPVTKMLVLDLDDIRDQLSPGFTELDNLEGMGLGPELDGGGRALLLVSDDNFRASQRTEFILLRLKGV